MQIRKCVESDIIPLGKFYDDEVKWLDDNDCNFPLWTCQGYPTTSTVAWTIGEGTQFICTEGEEIVGSFMLNTDPLGAYDTVPFKRQLEQGDYMILHMLSVSHRHTGKGIAKAMTAFAIKYAKEHGFKAIRLDVVPTNLPARRLYEGLGFHYAGDYDLKKGVEKIPLFSMYELNFD